MLTDESIKPTDESRKPMKLEVKIEQPSRHHHAFTEEDASKKTSFAFTVTDLDGTERSHHAGCLTKKLRNLQSSSLLLPSIVLKSEPVR
jgi:hypothetical protein